MLLFATRATFLGLRRTLLVLGSSLLLWLTTALLPSFRSWLLLLALGTLLLSTAGGLLTLSLRARLSLLTCRPWLLLLTSASLALGLIAFAFGLYLLGQALWCGLALAFALFAAFLLALLVGLL